MGKRAILSGVLLALCAVAASADERRQSGQDTERHPSRDQHDLPDSGQMRRYIEPRGFGVREDHLTAAERRDPAVRQYWTDKCVQQRARGWGRTGDCDNPAYSGGYRPRRYDYGWDDRPWGYPVRPPVYRQHDGRWSDGTLPQDRPHGAFGGSRPPR